MASKAAPKVAPGSKDVGSGKTSIRTTMTNPFGKRGTKRGAKRGGRSR